MPNIERLGGGRFEAGLIIAEAFKFTMKVPQASKRSFLEDPARFMWRFFEENGHTVNGFNITVAEDKRVKELVTRSRGDAEVQAVAVHVVEGGIGSDGHAYSISQYI